MFFYVYKRFYELIRTSLGIYRNAVSFVASNTTFGALPALWASNQRNAHRHHLSPATSPGKEGGFAVMRSLPCSLVNCKNVSSTTEQTTWVPESVGSVLQYPSRKYPVTFPVDEHAVIGEPRTFVSASVKCSLPETMDCLVVNLIHSVTSI